MGRRRLVAPARAGVAPARTLTAVVATALGLPLVTVVLLGLRDGLALGSVLLLYLFAVVVVSALGGLVPGLLAAAVSFMLANWFFTPPFHTLAVDSRDSVVELAVFAAAAIVVAAVVELAARDRLGYQQALDAEVARTRELTAEDRARAALLAAVGHDLRTPLASTKAAVSSLRQPDVTWPTDVRDELLCTIEESTDRLTRLVTNLLDMSRLRSDSVTARPAPVALDEVVGRAVLREHLPTLDVDVPDDLPLVLADAGLLERVVENLVENAVRFSPPGGRVEVRADVGTGPAGPPSGPAERSSGAASVRLRVVDHGPGIPPERRDEVFGAFQRLDDRDAGSHVGLGLAIARGFAEAMGATVVPSTTPGGGLTMTVHLPRAAAR